MINGELSYCRDCGECSTAELSQGKYAYCGACGSHDLTDMSGGPKFVPEFAGEE
jgi:anaerobic ribonucleoside-triphosphate reductase